MALRRDPAPALEASQPGLTPVRTASSILCCVLFFGAAFAADTGVSYEEYQQKKKELAAARDTVQRFEERVQRTGDTYQRLRAQRQLEMARRQLRDKQREFDGVRKQIQPGDRAFNEETHPGGRQKAVRLEDLAPRPPVDPMAGVYGRAEQVRGGSTGEVIYNKPPSALGQGRVDPQRWKIREKPAPGPARPSAKQYVVTPDKLGGEQSGGAPAAGVPAGAPVQDVDYVGKGPRWTFTPFDYTGKSERGETRRESLEESALIKSAMTNMRTGKYVLALGSAVRLAELRADDPRVRHLQAMLLNRLGRFAEAEAASREALRLGMRGPEVYESLALAQLYQEKYDAAADTATEAINADPSRSLAFVLRAYAYERLGREEDKKRDAAAAAARAPARFASLARMAQSGGALFDPAAPPAAALFFAASATEGGEALPWTLAGGILLAALCAAGGVYLIAAKKGAIQPP
ncbi:MAG: hypothetical protein ABIJ96_16150 [Elusimicrobiota bacterium]